MSRHSADDGQQPLISHHDTEHMSSDIESEDDILQLPTVNFRTAGGIVHFLTFSAGISGLLFGYDTGVVSSTLVCIDSDLSNRPLTTFDQSIITAVTSLVALFFAPTIGFFADRYGRKSVIFVPAVLFICGAVLQAVSQYVWVMVLGRGLVGAAIGVASGAVPLYITELAPAELRGTLVTIQALFITGGQVVAYLVGWAFSYAPHGWRWMVGLGAVPAAIQLLLLLWMPETPRWLLQKGQTPAAKHVLSMVYRNLPDELCDLIVERTCSNIVEEIAAGNKICLQSDDADASQSSSAMRHLTHTPSNRRALIIACLLQSLQQLCGFNSLMYFSATLLRRLGFTSPVGLALVVAGTNFLFTLFATYWIDILGRRQILLRSVPIMCVALIVCGLSLQFPNITPSTAEQPQPVSFYHILFLAALAIYVGAYATGLGCVPWQQSELFPLAVRSLGSSIATSTNWTCNFLVGISFLSMLDMLGPGWTFAVYAVICSAGWVCIYGIYPETAGLELEDIGELLREGWNVQGSVQAFCERRSKA